MSQGFSFKFDEMKEGDPSQKKAERGKSNSYAEAGHVRNICFVWPDGKIKFLNYAYLISGEYLPVESTINLSFTSATVIIKGSGLDKLFDELLGHLPKQIVCGDARYNVLDEGMSFHVNEIEVADSK